MRPEQLHWTSGRSYWVIPAVDAMSQSHRSFNQEGPGVGRENTVWLQSLQDTDTSQRDGQTQRTEQVFYYKMISVLRSGDGLNDTVGLDRWMRFCCRTRKRKCLLLWLAEQLSSTFFSNQLGSTIQVSYILKHMSTFLNLHMTAQSAPLFIAMATVVQRYSVVQTLLVSMCPRAGHPTPNWTYKQFLRCVNVR